MRGRRALQRYFYSPEKYRRNLLLYNMYKLQHAVQQAVQQVHENRNNGIWNHTHRLPQSDICFTSSYGRPTSVFRRDTRQPVPADWRRVSRLNADVRGRSATNKPRTRLWDQERIFGPRQWSLHHIHCSKLRLLPFLPRDARAKLGIANRKSSIRPSVRLSVCCLSVRLWR